MKLITLLSSLSESQLNQGVRVRKDSFVEGSSIFISSDVNCFLFKELYTDGWEIVKNPYKIASFIEAWEHLHAGGRARPRSWEDGWHLTLTSGSLYMYINNIDTGPTNLHPEDIDDNWLILE